MWRWLRVMGLLLAVGVAAAPDFVLPTPSGKVRGQPVAEGSPVIVYRGVPYARPPVGELRWRSPLAPEPWEGVRDCLAFGPVCHQPPSSIVRGPKGEQSEDCLYLNVWTAGVPGEGLPVMVWIHGGGFTIGAGSQRTYDGRVFAAQGVVLVTLNYRLGPFGFLAHPALSAETGYRGSGNYGLMDQIAALAWVRDNIAAFGGDPTNVTIFGESAGGVAVGALLTAPPARGLFQRAILQSGVPIRTTSLAKAEAGGLDLASRLGVTGEGQEAAAALRAVPADRLLAIANPRVGLFGKGVQFGPNVDGMVLPKPSMVALAAEEQAPVPVMLGTTADEGTLFLRQIPIKRPLGYGLFVRRFFGPDADEILAMFPAAQAARVKPALARLITASAFVAPTRRFARGLAAADPPVWLYQLTRVSPGGRRSAMGATHGVDVLYLYETFPEQAFDETDCQVARTMQQAWIRFATTGDPNGGELPAWPAFTREGDAHLEFGDEPAAGQGLWREECDLMDEIEARRRQRQLAPED